MSNSTFGILEINSPFLRPVFALLPPLIFYFGHLLFSQVQILSEHPLKWGTSGGERLENFNLFLIFF